MEQSSKLLSLSAEEPQTNSPEVVPENEEPSKNSKDAKSKCNWKVFFWSTISFFGLGCLCIISAYSGYRAYINMNQQADALPTAMQDLKQLVNSAVSNYITLKNEREELEHQYNSAESVLSSKQVSFIWEYCDMNSMQCLHCLPGWVEHDSRCFLLAHAATSWAKARTKCIRYGGDLAVVNEPENQEFLTDLTIQFEKQNPHFQAAWIGLSDLVQEGTFSWITGKKEHRRKYWHKNTTNSQRYNCVAIVPPKEDEEKLKSMSWQNYRCVDKQNFICETPAFK